MPQMQKLRVDGIDAGPHPRAVDPMHVAALAQSMEALGLRMPIEVQLADDGHAVLVTGLHRLMAAKHLGWEEIEVRALEAGELDDFDLQVWQIDENLLRRSLTEPELTELQARRQEILDAKLSIQTLQQEWERADQKSRLSFLDWIKRQSDSDGTVGRETQAAFLGWAQQQLEEQEARQADQVVPAAQATEPDPAQSPASEADTVVALQEEGPAPEAEDEPISEEQPAAALAGHPMLRAARGDDAAAEEPDKRPARRASRFLSLGAARA